MHTRGKDHVDLHTRGMKHMDRKPPQTWERGVKRKKIEFEIN